MTNSLKTTRRSFLATGATLGMACAFSAAAETSPKSGAETLRLTFRPYETQLRHTFTVAAASRKTTPGVLVELSYDGHVGYGEASMPPYLGESPESVTAFLKRVDLSRFSDSFESEAILEYVDDIAEGNTAAKASIDIALHDLTGKLLGVPCYKMFGGSVDRIPPTTFTIGIDKEEVVRQKTREAGDTYKILKVKLGLDTDKMMIETIRSVTDLPLAVDVNQGWKDRSMALEMIHWLKEKGVVMVEQPLPKNQLDDAAWLTARSPLPVFADESLQRRNDILPLKGCFSGINIKLMKCTGMREAWKMIDLGRACGMKIMLGCMVETSCAIAAAVHLSPFADFLDLDGNLLISNDPFRGVRLENGRQLPSDKPGLGLIKIETPIENERG